MFLAVGDTITFDFARLNTQGEYKIYTITESDTTPNWTTRTVNVVRGEATVSTDDISSYSTNGQVPTSKKVYDFVINKLENTELIYYINLNTTGEEVEELLLNYRTPILDTGSETFAYLMSSILNIGVNTEYTFVNIDEDTIYYYRIGNDDTTANWSVSSMPIGGGSTYSPLIISLNAITSRPTATYVSGDKYCDSIQSAMTNGIAPKCICHVAPVTSDITEVCMECTAVQYQPDTHRLTLYFIGYTNADINIYVAKIIFEILSSGSIRGTSYSAEMRIAPTTSMLDINNMDLIDIITTLINNVGFPIAAFIMVWIQNRELQKALNANTDAIQKLKSYMEDKLDGSN